MCRLNSSESFSRFGQLSWELNTCHSGRIFFLKYTRKKFVRYQYMWYSHPQQTFLADVLQKSRKSRVSHTDLTAPRAIVIRLSWNCRRLSNEFQRSAHKSYSQFELFVCWELWWTTPHTPDSVQLPLGLGPPKGRCPPGYSTNLFGTHPMFLAHMANFHMTRGRKKNGESKRNFFDPNNCS